MVAEIPGDIEGEDEENAPGFEDLGKIKKRGIFASYYNSIVGHLGTERTLKALSLGGHGWVDMSGRHTDDFRVLLFDMSEIKVSS